MKRRVAAAMVALTLTVPTSHVAQAAAPAATHVMIPHLSRWNRIAWCESGGQWHHRPVRNRYGTFSGGLMIWQRAWVAYGGLRYARMAYLASKANQIKVAEKIWNDRGPRAWQCK